MTNVQLLIAVGLPMLALAFGMYLNDRRFEAINGRIDDVNHGIDDRFETLTRRIDDMRSDFNGRIDDLRSDLSGRLTRVENAVENLISKLVEVDNRVIRIETKLGIS